MFYGLLHKINQDDDDDDDDDDDIKTFTDVIKRALLLKDKLIILSYNL